MKKKFLLLIFVIACLSINLLVVPVSADQLLKEDFVKESFYKTVDFFDYARAWAVLKGLEEPSEDWHANVYMTYVNKYDFQMLYAGLQNISHADNAFLTIPMQTILMHYKTQEDNQDVLAASSFLMIMGFNDTETSIHENSPDRNDNLWASFSIGVNLKEIFPETTFPAFTSESQTIPLTKHDTGDDDIEKWTWGMTYTNLTALWVTMDITEGDETDTTKPFGLATYDKLTFKYTLTLNKTSGTATIHKDFTIGHMRDLWVFGGWFLIWPIYNHYNSTGCFRYNTKVSNENVYEFLDKNGVEMSIVEYQKVIMVNRETYTVTEENEDDSTSCVSTYSENDKLIFNANFTAKPFYDLYDNKSVLISEDNEAVTRNVTVSGYAKNRNLFKFQTSFQRYVPLLLVGMYPEIYQQAKESITNIEVADCLYVISYGNYSGYRIEHDPVLTAYFTPTLETGSTGLNMMNLLFLAFMIVPIIFIIVIIRKRSMIH